MIYMQSMTEDELARCVFEITMGQATKWKQFEHGLIAYVIPTVYNFRLCYGDMTGVERAWCFETQELAEEALDGWMDDRDSPVGWHKEVHSGRRGPRERANDVA